MIYRRRASPLHAARAGVATAWLASITAAVLLQSNPIVLGAILVALLVAALRARVLRPLARLGAYAVLMGLGICVINALVSREGFTVIWRFGELPILGQTNVTLEATVYGAILGLRAVELILLGGLYSLTVDPDEVLRAMRRISFGSALSASVATRMVPILMRDAGRLADAQRCRPGPAPSRLTLMRVATAGALDRALDIAATLEVRGYSSAAGAARLGSRRWPGQMRRLWSRHDLAFAASALALASLAVSVRVTGVAGFRAYPTLGAIVSTSVLVVALAAALVVIVPTLARRGVGR